MIVTITGVDYKTNDLRSGIVVVSSVSRKSKVLYKRYTSSHFQRK